MDFDELLAKLRDPGEDGAPETIYDDIASTYNHAIETRDAKISEQEKAVLEREAEISALKSANYDLMMATTSSGDDDGSSDDDDTGEDEPAGVDDLFESEEG